jgi:biotin transport system substrate-specific component
VDNSNVREQALSFARVIVACCALVVCSKIIVPLKPVPVTLQCLAIYVIGFFYTPREAFCSVLSFLTLGLSGLPIFAYAFPGPALLLSPTGGYLLGQLFAAPLIALFLQKKGYSTVNLVVSSFIGFFVIFLVGVAVLASFIGFRQSIYAGILPFIIPELVKITVAVLIKKGRLS